MEKVLEVWTVGLLAKSPAVRANSACFTLFSFDDTRHFPFFPPFSHRLSF